MRDFGWGQIMSNFEKKQLKEIKELTTKLDIPFSIEPLDSFSGCVIGEGCYGKVWGNLSTITKLTELNIDEVNFHYDAAIVGLCPPLIKVAFVQNPDGDSHMALTVGRVEYELKDLISDPKNLPSIDKALATKVPLLDVIQQKYERCNMDAKIHNWMYNTQPNGEIDVFLIDWSYRPVRDITPEQCSQTIAATLILQIYEKLEQLNKLSIMEKPPKKLRLPSDCDNKCVSRISQTALLDRNKEAKKWARGKLPKLFGVARGILPISKPFVFEFN